MTDAVHDATARIKRFFDLVLALVAAAGLIMSAVVFGPLVERQIAPVWSGVAIEWGADGSAGLYGLKNRGACRLIEVFALVRAGEVWRRADIEVDGRTPRTTARPSGWQSLGTWTFSEAGDRLRITAHFRCHELWDTPATLGEWPMPGSAR